MVVFLLNLFKTAAIFLTLSDNLELDEPHHIRFGLAPQRLYIHLSARAILNVIHMKGESSESHVGLTFAEDRRKLEKQLVHEKSQTPSAPKAIQDALLVEGSLAVKLSTDCQSLEQLQEALLSKLSQNSLETRKRYSQSIIKWFFRDGIDGLLRNVWCAYGDEAIILDLLRYYYLTHEPLIGACVAESLFPLENGIAVPASYFDKFLNDFLGEPAPEKTRERLKINLKRLGFLERARGKPDRLTVVVPQKTSFLILLHHLFAPRSVRTVELRNLFTNPFWKYLGYKTEDALRSILREADAARVIGKYVAADQLEQVTTCFTYEELLKGKVRL